MFPREAAAWQTCLDGESQSKVDDETVRKKKTHTICF